MTRKNIIILLVFLASFLGNYGVASALTCSGPFTYDPWTDGGRNNYANGCRSQPNGCGNCWCPDDPATPAADPITPSPTNGSCGSRNADSYAATATDWATSDTFCSAGAVSPANPVFPSQGETTSWTCNGFNGGSDAHCQANRGVIVVPPPVNASCGALSKTYSAKDASWPSNTNFCANGDPSPASPTFPSQGNSVSWTCAGTNNGNNTTCQAKRENEIKEEKKDCKGEIGNYIWLDSNGNSKQDADEKGLGGIHVKLTFDSKAYRTTTNSKGRYSFEDLCKNDYIVTVKDEDVASYTQTYDPDSTKNSKTDIKLKNDHDSDMGADFGYKGKKIAPATGSGNIAIYISVLLTLITLITYRKIKARKIAYQK